MVRATHIGDYKKFWNVFRNYGDQTKWQLIGFHVRFMISQPQRVGFNFSVLKVCVCGV